jgi:hypothetical protein
MDVCICGQTGWIDVWFLKGEDNIMDYDNRMIEEVLKHLDSELAHGATRMSVIFDDTAEEAKTVSHKCCHSYGRPATETVGLLDMYTDISAGTSDRGL